MCPSQMVEPEYQELLNKDIPKANKNGVHVTVIAGESLGIKVLYTQRLYHLYSPPLGAKCTMDKCMYINPFLFISVHSVTSSYQNSDLLSGL